MWSCYDTTKPAGEQALRSTFVALPHLFNTEKNACMQDPKHTQITQISNLTEQCKHKHATPGTLTRVNIQFIGPGFLSAYMHKAALRTKECRKMCLCKCVLCRSFAFPFFIVKKSPRGLILALLCLLCAFMCSQMSPLVACCRSHFTVFAYSHVWPCDFMSLKLWPRQISMQTFCCYS